MLLKFQVWEGNGLKYNIISILAIYGCSASGSSVDCSSTFLFFMRHSFRIGKTILLIYVFWYDHVFVILPKSTQQFVICFLVHIQWFPSHVQGDLIKEGQTIGYLDQFGTELPVKVSLLFVYAPPHSNTYICFEWCFAFTIMAYDH